MMGGMMKSVKKYCEIKVGDFLRFEPTSGSVVNEVVCGEVTLNNVQLAKKKYLVLRAMGFIEEKTTGMKTKITKRRNIPFSQDLIEGYGIKEFVVFKLNRREIEKFKQMIFMEEL